MAGTSAESAKGLYIQVLIGVVAGALLGHFWPAIAVQMQPFGDAFIKLVRMIIAPIVFVTVVVGHRQADRRQGGRPHRHQGDRLFRGDDHDRDVHRPGRRAT